LIGVENVAPPSVEWLNTTVVDDAAPTNFVQHT
jgi:hypothetical protein